MLNKTTLFFGLFLILKILTHLPLLAQEEVDYLLVDASLYTNSGDTIEGKIHYTNHYNLQFNLTLSDTGGNILEYYSPKELTGFTYSLKDDEFVFISKDNPAGVGKVFLRILYQGRLSVYQFLELNSKSKYYSFKTCFYLWNREWLDPPITHEFEQKSLLCHFANCPELEYKIKTGEYGFSQIKKILYEYESCSLTDEYEFFYE